MEKAREANEKLEELKAHLVRDESGVPGGFDVRHYGNAAFRYALANDPEFTKQIAERFIYPNGMYFPRDLVRTRGKEKDILRNWSEYKEGTTEYKVAEALDKFEQGCTHGRRDRKKHELHTDLGRQWIVEQKEGNTKALRGFEEIILDAFMSGSAENFHSVIEHQRPAYELLDLVGEVEDSWLVHFSQDSVDISRDGFKIGYPQINGIALTMGFDRTYMQPIDNPVKNIRQPGYNFGFMPTFEGLETAARKYSGCRRPNAVVFKADRALEVYHKGDKENQAVFWGPSIDTSEIFPVAKFGDGWRLLADYEKPTGPNLGANIAKTVETVSDNPEMAKSMKNAA
jgi:hypothetical protein